MERLRGIRIAEDDVNFKSDDDKRNMRDRLY